MMSTEDDHFRICLVKDPDGENVFLVLTEDEFCKAKRRGELVLKARNERGEVDLNAVLNGCSIKLS